MKDFVQIIKDFDSVPKKRTDVETKGALWSVGHIGSTPLGLPLLVEAEYFSFSFSFSFFHSFFFYSSYYFVFPQKYHFYFQII